MSDDIPDLVETLPPDFAVKSSHLATNLEAGPAEPCEPSEGSELSDAKISSDGYPLSTKRKIPVTIVTGYLGSGKSTLLDMVARTSNKRLAIILNEFGDTAAIEKSVTIQDGDRGAVQEWLDLGNGCLCCTVKDNGVVAIENLVESARDKIDYILLETTGVADPAPIAKMFWLDDALASSVYIDGVVAVVDSANIEKCLSDKGGHWHRANGHLLAESGVDALPEESEREALSLQEGLTTAHLQIAMADCVLLNKVDLVENDPHALETLEHRLRKINASSPMYTTKFGDVDLEKILDLHAFEAAAAKSSYSLSSTSDLVYHDDRIRTVALDFPFFEDSSGFERAERFLQYVLWEQHVFGQAVEIHRLKGILVHGSDVRVVQGVRDTYDIMENGVLHPDIKQNKLVFIGKDLVEADLMKELQSFLSRQRVM